MNKKNELGEPCTRLPSYTIPRQPTIIVSAIWFGFTVKYLQSFGFVLSNLSLKTVLAIEQVFYGTWQVCMFAAKIENNRLKVYSLVSNFE